MSALQSRMGWLTDRQKVVAENVANASTPGFKPKDLKAQDFAALVQGQSPQTQLGLTLTHAMDIAQPDPQGLSHSQAVTSPDSETTMDGNSVVLEEQMMKMSESRIQFQAAVSFYEKSLDMIRMASKVPGK
ncbi:flagellar basal body rod protein FlgB [Asticcacaulis sp. EMRT-3]|uniref:flagellar basal body rod protein FlgB n=1 Tax=Asticcacaulis sp. EMRT-3 TaxID=3040349 RepID=UPI0032C22104